MDKSIIHHNDVAITYFSAQSQKLKKITHFLLIEATINKSGTSYTNLVSLSQADQFIPKEYEHILSTIPESEIQSFNHSVKTVADDTHRYIQLMRAIEKTVIVYGNPDKRWYFLYSRLAFVSTQYEELEQYYEEAKEEIKPIVAPFLGRIMAFQNNYDRAIELANSTLQNINIDEPELIDVLLYFEANFTLGLSYAYTRQFDLVYEVIDKLEGASSKFLFKKLIGEDHMLDYVFIENIIKGYTLFFSGKPQEMSDVLMNMREWIVNAKDPWLQGFYYNIYGISRIMFQELAEGERALRVAFKKFEEVHDLRGYATVGANLGMSLLTKGKRAEGREYLESVIGPQISMKNYWLAMGNMLEVAKSYLEERKEDQAREILVRAENIAKEQDIGDPNTYSMFSYFYARIGEMNKSEEFVEKLEKIREENKDDNYANLFYYMASSISAMHQGDLNRANNDIVEGIKIADSSNYFNYALELSMVHLEIILKRFLVEQKSTYILKAIEVAKDLTPLIEMTENPFYETLFYLLTAYLFLSVGNYSEASENYDLAEVITLDNEETAQYQELNLYQQRRSFITRAQPAKDVNNVLFDEFITYWLSDEYLPVFYTLEAKRLLQNLQFEKTSLEQKKEDEILPKLLFIVGAGGITIYSHRFDEDESLDEVLVGGFLSALTTFSQELFGGGMLTRIDQENHVLLMEKISETNILVMIVEKETYLLRKKFKQFSDELAKSKLVEYISPDQVLGEFDPQFQILEGIIEYVFESELEQIEESQSKETEKQDTEFDDTEELENDTDYEEPEEAEINSEEEIDTEVEETASENESEIDDDEITKTDIDEEITEDANTTDEDTEDSNEDQKDDYIPSFMRYENEE